jgi:hypothetical protein
MKLARVPMTIELYAWKAPLAHEPVLAGIFVAEHLEGASRLEPSPDVVRFGDTLAARFPATAIDRSDRLIVMQVSEDAPDELLAAIPTLAWEHDLVLYDPRASRVQAQRHIPPAPFPTRGLIRAMIAGLVGAAIMAAAYVASIPLLSGVLIVVGAFVVVMSLISLPAMVIDWRRSHRPTVDQRRPEPIQRFVTPAEPEEPFEPEDDPTELATPTERIVALRGALRRAGWRVVDGGPTFDQPRALRQRYPPLPPAYVEFVDGLIECLSPDETAWFLTRHDFTGRSHSGYRWDEWERMMLEVDTPEERPTTRAFWDRHVPILFTVGGDLGYLALALVGSGSDRAWGPVRQAFGPDWDGTTDVSPSFEAFLATLARKLTAKDPERAVADWLLI